MKSTLLSLSVLASVTTLAASAVASERINHGGLAPAPATVAAISSFVGRHVTELTVYPTADRGVVFVSYHTDGGHQSGDHIGLVKAHDGQVTRYTDFTGSRPRHLSRITAESAGDAQAQARALLMTATAKVTPAATTTASTGARTSAQTQAAELLRAAPGAAQPAEHRRLAAMKTPAVRGDSQAMARALLTASTGE